MRKVHSEYENPLTDIILDSCDELVPFCVKYGITPNMITIFRFILSILIVYILYATNDIIFVSIGTLICVYLDNLDGYLARNTKQVSYLGDILDHISDIFLYNSLLFYIIYSNMNTFGDSNLSDFYESKKITIFIIILIILYLSLVSLGLTQKKYNLTKPESPKETLDLLNLIHPFEIKDMSWVKYFGDITVYLTTLLVIIIIKNCNVKN